MKRNLCTFMKVAVYAFFFVLALYVCAGDKSVIAKVMLCADFALVAFMGDCLLDRPAKKRNSQQEKAA